MYARGGSGESPGPDELVKWVTRKEAVQSAKRNFDMSEP